MAYMLFIYKALTYILWPVFHAILSSRIKAHKEDPARINERKGISSCPRPQGKLVWIHAASVGEAQSTIILINTLLQQNPDLNIMVTTGTITSAQLMVKKLPPRTFHQYYPLDHPTWVNRFIDFWAPDFVFWMESELWPNMLGAIKKRNITAALINARLSDKSFKNWLKLPSAARGLLGGFNLVLAQTDKDRDRFSMLLQNNAQNIHTTDNIKFSAPALPVNQDDLNALKNSMGVRPHWVFSSTHAGEEEMACRIHTAIKATIPDILTIIAPRHPERRDEIIKNCAPYHLNMILRSDQNEKAATLPSPETDIYISDTMGELGLLYTLSPIACIGRSFSDDGGGGHNPIEAAQLNCIALYGPNVQYQQDIYNEMSNHNAAIMMNDENHMTETLLRLLQDNKALTDQQARGLQYADKKSSVIDRVMKHLAPLLKTHDII